MGVSLLEVRGLRAGFDIEGGRVVAVDDVSFCVERNTTLGIVGESGCGKSVTAFSILRLLPQPAGRILTGEVYFDGIDLTTASHRTLEKLRGNEISMIFQEPMTALNPVHRVGPQLVEAIQLHQKMSARDAAERAVEMLRHVRIASPEMRFYDYPHQLSGGMRQRVMIAMALVNRPKLLIADEPTTALDVTVQAQILKLIADLQREIGMAVVLITHDLGVIAETCDEVAVMYAGRLVERAPVRELFAQPRHAYTRGLLASIPRLDSVPKTKLPIIPGQVATLETQVTGCRFCQRMGRDGGTGRPPFIQTAPNHWVEACEKCTTSKT
ncbi:MAG: ABC transporter ATP-binding protein [Verrucomicrobiales bacterium]